MSGSEKICGKSLVKSETLLNIVVRQSGQQITNYIFHTANNRAGSCVLSLRAGHSVARKGGSSFLYIYATNFCTQMRQSEKVSAVAQGASIATVSVRKSASKPVQAKPIKRYYQVHFRAQRINLGVSNLECSHPFLATSREEAVGMAIDYLVGKWPHYNLLAETITCYPLNLKSAAL